MFSNPWCTLYSTAETIKVNISWELAKHWDSHKSGPILVNNAKFPAQNLRIFSGREQAVICDMCCQWSNIIGLRSLLTRLSLQYFFWNSGCTGACSCLYCFLIALLYARQDVRTELFSHPPTLSRGSAVFCLSWSWSHLFISKHLLYEMQINNTVHPQNVRFQNVRFQNVRFQNVRFQNVWNVRFTKRQVYKMSGLQNVRFTKRQVFKTSGCKKTSIYILYCGWW